VTRPVTVLVQSVPVTVGSLPAHMAQGDCYNFDWQSRSPRSVAGRPELLEEAWLADPQEGIVGFLAVERIGLQPLSPLAIRSAPGVATTP